MHSNIRAMRLSRLSRNSLEAVSHASPLKSEPNELQTPPRIESSAKKHNRSTSTKKKSRSSAKKQRSS